METERKDNGCETDIKPNKQRKNWISLCDYEFLTQDFEKFFPVFFCAEPSARGEISAKLISFESHKVNTN